MRPSVDKIKGATRMHEQLSNLPGRHHAPVQRHSQGWSRLTGLGALLMGLGVPGAVLATVDLAQRPLISSEGSSPKPNLMLTVDTSGSMSLRHMPEGTAKVNGVDLSVTTGSMWRVHPGDWDTNELQPGQSAANLVALTTMPSSVTQGQLNVNQLRAQIYARTPAVNTVYYDPRVRYRPWATLSTPTGRFPDAKFNRAYVDPNRQVDTNPNHRFVDFTQISNYRICVRPGVCTNGSFSQRPAIVYMLQSSSANPTNLGNFVRYDIFGGGPFPGRSAYPGRTDCSLASCTAAQEQQNFANWFVYYRTRMLATQAALSEAFHDMDNIIRVGWTTIRHARSNRWVNGGVPIIQGVKDLDASHRQLLLDTVQNRNNSGYFIATGTTELRITLDEVGQYFTRNRAYSPWENDPAPLISTAAASGKGAICRRSYNMLTTDGYYNDVLSDFNNLVLPGDLDTGAPTYANYTRSTPYRDRPDAGGYSNTLADFALKYWAQDLSPIANGIRPTATNEATWQHLTQFTVGMGVEGTLTPTEATLDQLKAGSLSWPDPTSGNLEKIDDLWHAAVNTRGAYYNVRTASDLEQAVRDMVNRAVGENLRESGVATASTALQADNIKFTPEYNSGNWTGKLFAYRLNALGQIVNPATGVAVPAGTTPDPLWEASSALPGPSARSLFTTGDAPGTLVPFVWSATGGDMGSTNRQLMSSIQTADANLVNYLRGDRSLEGSGEGKLRKRESVLADIINSTPVFARGNLDMQYDSLPGIPSGSYTSFLGAKAGRANPMVFVGSNGGMVHGFSASNGTELFGFVPRGVLPNLYKLAEQSYGKNAASHRYFVDGPMSEHDVYVSGEGWANLLVGSLGSGGRGLFALRLPVSGTAGAQPELLWDLTDGLNGSVANYIGHIHSPAESGKLPNGGWKIFVANGVNSPNGQAALLMIDPQTGAVDALPVGSAQGNALTGVALVRNAQREVVAAYAGDLKGQLWRFELDSGRSTLVLGYGGKPLFVTSDKLSGQAQPITSAPVVYRQNNKQVVLFGTGQLWAESDRANQQLQSFYGILDEVSAEQASADNAPSGISAVQRSNLVGQTISLSGQTGFRTVSSNQQETDSKGWVLDLSVPTGTSQPEDLPRVIYAPQLIRGFVFFTAVSPAPDAAECEEAGGQSYGFLLPALNGAQFSKPVYDTNGDGVVNSSDNNSAGFVKPADGPSRILIGAPEKNEDDSEEIPCSLQGGSSSQGCRVYDTKPKPTCETNPELPECQTEPPPPGSLTVQDRVWQRILPPPDRTPAAPPAGG